MLARWYNKNKLAKEVEDAEIRLYFECGEY